MSDKDYAIVLVWLERNNGRVYLQDWSVVSSRHSTNSTQMSPGTRPRGRTGTTGVLLHRPQYGAFRNHRDLCNAMGNGGHIPGGACAPRNRNSAPVVRKSDHAHHTILLGIYSLVCLWAHQALETNPMSYAAAWYKKTHFTFSDAIAVIRYEIFLSHSPPNRKCDKNQSRLFKRLLYSLCFPS